MTLRDQLVNNVENCYSNVWETGEHVPDYHWKFMLINLCHKPEYIQELVWL